ncbi:MAG: prepilin-type N-terminal cleavage/methylation domain-containing protein [Planctomycetes bacterium]|nr:prepilin-type N-terminal cleavage/methylation domain-containing protein [Planctomycetota bacterium]
MLGPEGSPVEPKPAVPGPRPAPAPAPAPDPGGGTWQVSMRTGGAPRRRRGFTLLEALIASVIVAMVAATASMSVAVGAAVEEQNRLSVLAMQAAELQMSSLLEQPYETVGTLAGTEAAGSMKAPARPGGSARPDLPSSFARLSRTTAVTAENRTFTQLNNHTVEGKRLEVTVTGPDGSTLARLVRFRGKEPDT